MRMQLCPIAVTFALLGSVSLAAAQSAPGGANAQEKLNLSQSKEQQVTQGLIPTLRLGDSRGIPESTVA